MELKTSVSEYDIYEVAGNDFTKQFYKPPRVASFEYSENSLPVGVDLRGNIVTVNLRNAARIIIMGTTGAGKTFKLRGMTDRRHKLNYCVVNLTDVKNEMGSSNKPVQEKFVKYLLEGEEPCRTPVIVLRPTFYKAISEELPKHNHWFSPLFSDMEKIDFMTMMGLDDKSISQAQKDAGDALFNKMKLEPKKYKTYEDLAALIDSIDELTQKQKDRFKLSVKNMFDSKFFMTGDVIIHDPIALSADDLVVSFNHEGFDMFAKTGRGYPQVLVSMMIRKYTRARIAWVNGEKGAVKINRLFFDGDEGNSFFPANKEPSSKVEAVDSVKKDRRYGIYWNFAFQAWVDIPLDIISQSRYCFLPHNVDLVDMQQAFENFTTMRVTSERKNRLREIQKQCRNIPHSWIMLDRETGVHTIFIPLPPMSYHMEMSK